MSATTRKLILACLTLIALTIALASTYLDKPEKSSDQSHAKSLTDTGKNLLGKRILWVNSYHKGYVWSDSEFKGAEKVFRNTGVILKQVFMDTKRHDSLEFGKKAGVKIKNEIKSFNPDVIIAADDPAQKYLIVPYVKNTLTPVVFCGVNWDASDYGYPAPNITGIIEVDLMENLLGYLHEHAKGEKVAFVSGNDLSERKILNFYSEKFLNGKLMDFMPEKNTFEDFCKAFMKAQQAADHIIIGGNGSIIDWNNKKAIEYFRNNTIKPTGTANFWMHEYALISYSKVGEEQGEWAANAAIKIMNGTSPSDIPLSKNKLGQLYINLDIADNMDIVFSPTLLKNARFLRPDSSGEQKQKTNASQWGSK